MTNTQEFDFSVNLLDAIIWQYDSASNIRSMLESKSDWYTENQTDFWQNWITDVFDLRTANEFGLSVWSIILGQPLYTSFPPSATGENWGFGEYRKNFGNGNFAASSGASRTYSLSTSRLLLQLRYFKLISSGTVPATNRMLQYIFAEEYGNAYLVDNHDMTQTYTFEFAIPAEISYMLNNTDVLPRPAGVLSTITEI